MTLLELDSSADWGIRADLPFISCTGDSFGYPHPSQWLAYLNSSEDFHTSVLRCSTILQIELTRHCRAQVQRRLESEVFLSDELIDGADSLVAFGTVQHIS